MENEGGKWERLQEELREARRRIRELEEELGERRRQSESRSPWICEDITESAQAETARRESEEKYRLLVENSYDLIWTMTAAGVFTYVSPSWRRVLGHDPAAIVGRPFQSMVHPDDVAVCEAYLREAISARREMPGPAYRVRHADGAWRWHMASGAPVFAADGSFVSFVDVPGA